MFVFIPGSIPPVRFGPAGTDPAEISIPAVTYIHIQKSACKVNLSIIDRAKILTECVKL